MPRLNRYSKPRPPAKVRDAINSATAVGSGRFNLIYYFFLILVELDIRLAPSNAEKKTENKKHSDLLTKIPN